jgi:predicted MFS family arabinose efflux permease
MLPAVLAMALALGASAAEAGLVTMMAAAGQVLAAVPAGQLTARMGTRVLLPVSAALVTVGLLSLLLAGNIAVLGAGVFVVGVGSSAHGICRLSTVAKNVNAGERPTVFAQLAMSMRVGWVGGPLVGAAAFWVSGDVRAPILVAVTIALAATVIHIAAGDGLSDQRTERQLPAGQPTKVADTISSNVGPLKHVAALSAIVAGLRHTKIVLIPLVALDLGFNLGQVSALVAGAAVVGIGAMYGAPPLSSRFGFMAAGTVSNLGITAGLVVLFFAGGPLALIIAVLIIEVANGIGAGFMSTVFAAAAPADNPAPLIGVFNLLAELMAVAVPAAVMGVVAAAALPIGVAAGALFGVAGTGVLVRMMLTGRTAAS